MGQEIFDAFDYRRCFAFALLSLRVSALCLTAAFFFFFLSASTEKRIPKAVTSNDLEDATELVISLGYLIQWKTLNSHSFICYRHCKCHVNQRTESIS